AFLRAENLAVFDHVTRRLKLLTIHRPDREDYVDAVARIDAMQSALAEEPVPDPPPPAASETWRAHVSRPYFESMVDAAREEILAGEAFQVVLSQRFSKPLGARPLDVYRCLRALNPSPYMYYLDLGDGGQIVGASPEVLVQVEDRRIRTRPLAGTRRRG